MKVKRTKIIYGNPYNIEDCINNEIMKLNSLGCEIFDIKLSAFSLSEYVENVIALIIYSQEVSED